MQSVFLMFITIAAFTPVIKQDSNILITESGLELREAGVGFQYSCVAVAEAGPVAHVQVYCSEVGRKASLL